MSFPFSLFFTLSLVGIIIYSLKLHTPTTDFLKYHSRNCNHNARAELGGSIDVKYLTRERDSSLYLLTDFQPDIMLRWLLATGTHLEKVEQHSSMDEQLFKRCKTKLEPTPA